MSLNNFFRYFGGKAVIARYYPKPLHETIVEPFAGGAGYSLRHHYKRVVLIEKDPKTASVWRYLLRSSPRDLLALPSLEVGQGVDTLDVCEEARALISMWMTYGAASQQGRILSPHALEDPDGWWGRTVRARLAWQVEKIRHWQIIEGDYTQAPDVEATWFVDPPYEIAGRGTYSCDATGIDFAELGAWCKTRRGQVMVCENEGASWLPFKTFRTTKATGTYRLSREAIWTNDGGP